MYGGKTYRFYLNISADELMRVYTGSAKKLRVTADTGQVIELDASHLRGFTTRSGIRGEFKLVTDSANRFIRLEKMS